MSDTQPGANDQRAENPPAVRDTDAVLAEAAKEKLKTEVAKAYDSYAAGTGSIDAVLSKTRELAYRKLRRLEFDFQYDSITEDYAQEITVTVWRSFEGDLKRPVLPDGLAFYNWVHRIIFNERNDATRGLIDARRNTLPLDAEYENGEGENEINAHPEVLKELTEEQRPLVIPTGMEADALDGHILGLVGSSAWDDAIQGYRVRTYADIAAVCGITESAVKKRVERMRARVEQTGYYRRRKASIARQETAG